MARPSGSTAPCRPNGPTPPPGPPTMSAPPLWTAGWSTTTLPAATPPSEAAHRSVASPREQPVRSLHLEGGALPRAVGDRLGGELLDADLGAVLLEGDGGQ